MTVQGVPHNRVVGIILEEGGNVEKPNSATGTSAVDSKPGYRYDDEADKKKLLLFNGNQGTSPHTMKATSDGHLWVVINDADAYRWDDVGIFFLKITVS